MSVCCFTGHRDLGGRQKAVYDRMCLQVEALAVAGFDEFRAGGALGFDTVAAMAVIKVREQYPHIRLVLYVPCKGQERSWQPKDQQRYKKIWELADEVKVLSEHYYKGCMFVRNRALVDGSDLCVAYLKEKKGGTAMTVQYAQKQKVTVINMGDLV